MPAFPLVTAYVASDQAARAVEVLERTRAAVGDADPGLALVLEAWIALAGMLDERTAPTALRRARRLHGQLRTQTDPPVDLLAILADHANRANRAAEAQELAERALACERYPPPLSICSPTRCPAFSMTVAGSGVQSRRRFPKTPSSKRFNPAGRCGRRPPPRHSRA
jgi:hypothetical protein